MSGWRELYPFTSHFHQLESLQMHFLDEGEGDPLVMIHGNPTWSFFYRDLITAFKPTHRCIAPDHIGCGLSDKPQHYDYALAKHIDNLESLLEQLLNPGERVTLVLHDWGGAIGMGYACRHPARIGKLVILNTSAFLSPEIPLRINVLRIPIFGSFMVRAFNAFAGCATFMTTVKPLPPLVRAGFVAPYDSWRNRIATIRFVQDIPMSPQHRSYSEMQKIEAGLSQFADRPMLIQWGSRDWCFTTSFCDGWRERFPEAECDIYEDAGHYLLEDAGDQIINRVQEFLQCRV